MKILRRHPDPGHVSSNVRPAPTFSGRSSYQSQAGVLGRMMNMQAPVVIMDGHRAHGAIVPGVFAQPQRPGTAILWTRRGTDGVLVGWSDPPVIPRRR
jgi:S-DNA-T family DNA segregation ATPase FtsK/SpoIIIE